MRTRFHFYNNYLLISGKLTLLRGLERLSTTCRAATAARKLHKRKCEELTPLGGLLTPDIYDHGSMSLLIHGLCIQAIYDLLPCALAGQLIIDRNLTPQISPHYTLVTSLVNYLVTKHRYMKLALTVIRWRKTSESDLFCIFP